MAASGHQSAAISVSDSSRIFAQRPQTALQNKEHITLPLSSFHGRALSIKPLISQGQCRLSQSARWVSSSNEVAVDGSASAVSVAVAKLEMEPDKNNPKEPLPTTKEATISSVMADVANLVKLVDSRDIVELELKHLDYELVIRKKEALAPPSAPPSFQLPQAMAQAPFPTYAPPLPPSPVAASAPSAPPVQSSPPPAAPASLPVADGPRILSPMAGIFYKCPAPGEPPFVKVGDKVQKGQVICIVEAMKLMNEIEADRSGTIIEILAGDGKPVAVDTPLFAIKP